MQTSCISYIVFLLHGRNGCIILHNQVPLKSIFAINQNDAIVTLQLMVVQNCYSEAFKAD